MHLGKQMKLFKGGKNGPQLERQLQKSIMSYLNYQKDLEAESIDTKGTWINKGGGRGYFRKASTCRGFPDIMGWLHSGRIFFIEVKTESGRLSAEQKQFRDRCIATNAYYCVCRSLSDVTEFLTKIRGEGQPS